MTPSRCPPAACALAFATLCFTAAAGAAESAAKDNPAAGGAVDHAAMGHDMAAGRDAEGRSFYGMTHEMPPAMLRELRERVPLYRNHSDAEIRLSMENMGHEYAWYISPADLKANEGVLILMHGFREQGDRIFRQQVQPIGDIFPTSLGVGMAMMMSDHIQVALDDLTDAGARDIAVVPITSSSTNELYRQWLYILGKEKEPEFATVPRVKTGAKLHFIDPPGADPLVAEAVLDHALEISTDPKNEMVIIAGHGPTSPEDNAAELQELAKLAKVVKADGGFADVIGMTLQDDSPPEIRAGNVKKMREAVQAATAKGRRVLVVTNLIGARTVQAKLRGDLKDLDYEFNAKGLIQHPNFMKWMREAIREEFEKS